MIWWIVVQEGTAQWARIDCPGAKEGVSLKERTPDSNLQGLGTDACGSGHGHGKPGCVRSDGSILAGLTSV
jgi:hypothetical protein